MLELREVVVPVPDEELVALAKSGDLSGVEELLRRHYGISKRVARRYLGNEQDAEDAVQDGFVKVLRSLDHFDGRSGFRTWLLRVVTNAALDLGRRRKRRANSSFDELTSSSEPGIEIDPAAGLANADLRRRLDEALSQLSPEIRSTFVLVAEAECSYQQVAEIQEVPIGTVMSRVHYARKKLQAWLTGPGAEPD